MRTKINMVGERYGRLTVLKQEKDKVYCRCDCGNEKWFDKKNVRRGRSRSCGCILKEVGHANLKNIVGQRFGQLTVKWEVHDGFVLCHCDCGREKIVGKSNLVQGRILSCGCTRLKGKRTIRREARRDFVSASSKSGVRGVVWSERAQAWRAMIIIHRHQITLGQYKAKESAITARQMGEKVLVRREFNADNIVESNKNRTCGIVRIDLPANRKRYAVYVTDHGNLRWLGAWCNYKRAHDTLLSNARNIT